MDTGFSMGGYTYVYVNGEQVTRCDNCGHYKGDYRNRENYGHAVLGFTKKDFKELFNMFAKIADLETIIGRNINDKEYKSTKQKELHTSLIETETFIESHINDEQSYIRKGREAEINLYSEFLYK